MFYDVNCQVFLQKFISQFERIKKFLLLTKDHIFIHENYRIEKESCDRILLGNGVHIIMLAVLCNYLGEQKFSSKFSANCF